MDSTNILIISLAFMFLQVLAEENNAKENTKPSVNPLGDLILKQSINGPSSPPASSPLTSETSVRVKRQYDPYYYGRRRVPLPIILVGSGFGFGRGFGGYGYGGRGIGGRGIGGRGIGGRGIGGRGVGGGRGGGGGRG